MKRRAEVITSTRPGGLTMRIEMTAVAIVVGAAIAAPYSLLPPLHAQPAPPQPPAAATPSRSVRDGVYTEEQAKRGERLYGEECSHCHGPALDGGESAPLIGSAFAESWKGTTLADLFERIKMSMPQDDPGRLSPQQAADAIAYIL